MVAEQNNEQAAAALEAHRTQITSDLMDNLIQDPVYETRFGSEWKFLIKDDINQHLDNLILAVRFNLIDSPNQHYRYIQNLLVNRGRCTQLISEMIAGLQSNIQRLVPEYFRSVEPFLKAGESGIAYSDPGSKSLAAMRLVISSGAADQLAHLFAGDAGKPGWLSDRTRELVLLTSYLADSLEKSNPKYFADFVALISNLHSKAGINPKVLDQELNSISKEITRHLEPATARRLRPIIYKVRRGG